MSPPSSVPLCEYPHPVPPVQQMLEHCARPDIPFVLGLGKFGEHDRGRILGGADLVRESCQHNSVVVH
jgi:hypothetical protein